MADDPARLHDQLKVDPALTATFLGPDWPSYRSPPIVTRSCPASVSKWVAVSKPALLTRMVHASLLPWAPAPSVTQPLRSIAQ